MSGNDDIPDYLKGVDNGVPEQDDFTIRSDATPAIGSTPVRKAPPRRSYDDEEDDEDERRPRRAFPFQALLLVFAAMGGIVLLIAAGVAAFGTWIADAEKAALSATGSLSRVIDEERKIIDELGSRGANRTSLMSKYVAIDEADGHARGRAAFEFAVAVDHEIVTIGDVRGSTIFDRQQKLTAAQKAYDEAMSAWEGAAYNPVGKLAVAAGIANAPPSN